MRKGTSKMLVVLSLAVFFGASGLAQARVRRNQVRSKHIKEADGTSGQNTNTGSGIKTGHIQDGAVTAAKIAGGPGSGVDADTVDGLHVADLQDYVDGAVTTHTGIADAHHTKYTDAEAKAAVDDGTYEKLYNNVIVVASDGNGDYTDPVAALASITDNGINTPYLVKIMPGVYDIGTNSVQMKQYVDIEGCGENTTKIIGTIDGETTGVVQGADNAELRLLSVENTGGGTYAVAIYNSNASPKLTNVTATASGGTINNHGVCNSTSSPTMTNVTATASGGAITNHGVTNLYSSSPTMTNVTATASGGLHSNGVRNSSSSPTMTNVTATASGGTIINYGVSSIISSTIKIDHSVISGTTNTVYTSTGATTYVGNTRLDGGPVGGGGTTTCAGVYDENYTFYANTCP